MQHPFRGDVSYPTPGAKGAALAIATEGWPAFEGRGTPTHENTHSITVKLEIRMLLLLALSS